MSTSLPNLADGSDRSDRSDGPESPFLTVNETARFCRVSRYAVLHWLRTGKLSGVKIGGGQWRVRKWALLELERGRPVGDGER